MASAKEIQARMKSIRDTMKITNAMYMISSSKMKRAKRVLADTEPYFYNLQSTISRILRHMPDVEHVFFDTRPQIPEEERKIGCIVVTADKGLAGAYNHNVIKMTEDGIINAKGHPKLYVLGIVGQQYFRKKNVDMDEQFHYTVQKPTMHRARVIAREMVEEFVNGHLDEVDIIFTEMVSAISMETKRVQILPLKKSQFSNMKIPVDVQQEVIRMVPSTEAVLDQIVPNYVTGYIYGCLVESYASENNARMTAMQSSTDNAKEMLREVSIQYNRARQAAITQEITEVISGAKAQKRK